MKRIDKRAKDISESKYAPILWSYFDSIGLI